jgi:uncharacterized OB-fold protein
MNKPHSRQEDKQKRQPPFSYYHFSGEKPADTQDKRKIRRPFHRECEKCGYWFLPKTNRSHKCSKCRYIRKRRKDANS